MSTLAVSRIGRSVVQRRNLSGIIVALVTTVVMNGLLVVLLLLLDRPRALPLVAPVPLHRLTIVTPKKMPTVATVLAAATLIPAATPMAPVVPLPAIIFPPTASGAVLTLPQLPMVDVVRPISMPTVLAAMPTAAAGDSSTTLAATAASSVVDEPPVLINGFDLERFYPRNVRLRGIEGSSSMRLEISPEGKVTAAAIIASEPPGVFDAAAQALCKTLHYTPARTRGNPVACVITLVVEWRLPR